MRPENLKTRIFLDGGDPEETKDIIKRIGFIDGQTTNPSLIAKNPSAKKRMERGEKFTKTEILHFYRGVVEELSALLPRGSVSVEVYADASTAAQDMIDQAGEMFSWIPNAHIKFPTSQQGLIAAEEAVRSGIRVNMTLCFTQEQSAAVYAATKGAKKGDVFISPFIGRLDDRGQNGMDLIANIIRMYKTGDGHVEVLTASVRSMDHHLFALKLGSDIITAPYSIIRAWGDKGLIVPGDEYVYDHQGLKAIPYKDINLTKHYDAYDIRHDLTDKGMERFSADWNALIQ
jgi:transaldolase